jgi:hypothetical protein
MVGSPGVTPSYVGLEPTRSFFDPLPTISDRCAKLMIPTVEVEPAWADPAAAGPISRARNLSGCSPGGSMSHVVETVSKKGRIPTASGRSAEKEMDG